MRKGIVILLLLCLLAACRKQPGGGSEVQSGPELTVLIGTDGFGDCCYNDNMLSGILGFCDAHPEVELKLQQPSSIADAGKRLDTWLAAEDGGERALILASNSYESILQGKPAPKNGRVLILETDDVFPGHSSYIIRRYGASWLCGAMSGEFSPVILKAMDGNNMIDESEMGFRRGHGAVSTEPLYCWTIADGPEGFAMRDSTYRFVYWHVQEIIYAQEYVGAILFFPLLGGSLPGVFDYGRYIGFVFIAGMDVDCSVYDPYNVPYSLCVNNHLVLKDYLEDWLEGKPWPEHAQFGLETDFVEVKVNPGFSFRPGIMEELYEEYYPQALEMEKAYVVP